MLDYSDGGPVGRDPFRNLTENKLKETVCYHLNSSLFPYIQSMYFVYIIIAELNTVEFPNIILCLYLGGSTICVFEHDYHCNVHMQTSKLKDVKARNKEMKNHLEQLQNKV